MLIVICKKIGIAQFMLFRSLRTTGAPFPAQQHSATFYKFTIGKSVVAPLTLTASSTEQHTCQWNSVAKWVGEIVSALLRVL